MTDFGPSGQSEPLIEPFAFNSMKGPYMGRALMVEPFGPYSLAHSKAFDHTAWRTQRPLITACAVFKDL